MTMTYSNSHGAGDSNFVHQRALPALPELYAERPAIKIPRSAKRDYTDSELSTAAAMLARMRNRADVIDELRKHDDSSIPNAESALDAVIEKLLDAI
jgi:hypothetical protein